MFRRFREKAGLAYPGKNADRDRGAVNGTPAMPVLSANPLRPDAMDRRALLIAATITPLLCLPICGQAREPIVGGPCEGCEAVFLGRPTVLSPQARIAPLGEPGEPLVLSGRVVDRAGRPAAGIVVYAYHTDRHGLYRHAPGLRGAAARHGALRGWAMTDAAGRYRFETIRPGSYPGRDVPQHIHMHVIEPGRATYYIDDVMFADDPKLTAAQRRLLASGRGDDGIVMPSRTAGAWHAVRDIALGANIPGAPW